MENNYFDTIERISGRLDKLCKKGIVTRYRAGSGSNGYSLIIEEPNGRTLGFEMGTHGAGFTNLREEQNGKTLRFEIGSIETGFEPIEAELKRLEKGRKKV